MSLRPCGTTGEKVNHKAKKQVSSLTFCTILDITNKNKFAESLSKKGERRGVIADLDLTGFIKMTAWGEDLTGKRPNLWLNNMPMV